MKRTQTSLLYSERALDAVAAFVKDNRYTIWGSLLSAFLAYTFMITNKLPNHDELFALFNKGTTVESGRWGLDILSRLLPDVSVPWLYGVISIVLLTIGSCLIVRIFKIKTRILQMLLGGIILTFPAQISTFTFMYTASAYAVAFLLAVAAVYFLTLPGKKNWLIAALCFIGSLSIYQAYLSITVSLLLLYLFFELLNGREDEKKTFIRGLGFVAFLVISLLMYWLATKAVWHFTGRAMGQYADSAFSLDARSLLNSVKNAYVAFYHTFRYRVNGLIISRVSLLIHLLIFALTGCAALFQILKKNGKQIALLLFLLLLLPLGIGSMYVLFSEQSIHTLVLYSYIAVYVLFAGIVESCQQADIWGRPGNKLMLYGSDAVVFCMAVILAGNIFVANKSYLYMHLSYENTYFYTTAILTQLQDTPGYHKDAKVAIVGQWQEPDFYSERFYELNQLKGVNTLSPNAYSIAGFFQYYNGVSLNLVAEEEIDRIAASSEFQQMESYPNHGYIQTIDDTIVIKLSDVS